MSTLDSVDILLFCLKDFIVYLFHIYDIFGLCRYDHLKHSMHRPFFCNPHFYPSPPKSWQLPSYANDLANELAEGSFRTVRPKKLLLRGLDYFDVEAVESEDEGSSDADSIHSEVSAALSANCDFDYMT